VTFVGIMDNRDRVLSHCVARAFDPSDEDEPAGDALSLNHRGPLLSIRHVENNVGT
jgi:hypothetical protein